jgi:mono/diheme cytochrome c family protein
MRGHLFVPITVSLLSLFFFSPTVDAQVSMPDWSEGAPVPAGGRGNIYQWQPQDFFAYQKAGKIHAQIYPVDITGMLPPYQPIKKFLGDSFYSDLGLHPYPKETDQGVYQMPYPEDIRPETRVGFGLIERNGAKGFTFSCAACHSANLFGKTVLGMTNRFPKANNLFVKAKKAMPLIDPWIFKITTGASDAEADLLSETKNNLKRVAVKDPIQLGLDTSLAQVGLSLNRRSPDADATPSEFYEEHPRKDEFLDKHPADSKPAVWWNVKYKDRWLSDGSVVSGNPIFTNILWNEIGRGTDLSLLKRWLSENKKIIDELATAVFSSEAPKITDFFSAEKIDLMMAKKGQALFNDNCARCHGVYEKAWDLPNADQLSLKQKLGTTLVKPKAKTPVVDVGTDAARREGMKSLEQLNNLAISKENGIIIKTQNGYVPPPLVGIWARWPYFHNNSAPSLCAVLTPGPKRPVAYYAGEANDPDKDFDFDCNGYPLGNKTPNSWKSAEFYYDTRREGMSNRGHDEDILLDKDGKEIFSADDKKALIRFLQTL